MTRISENQWVDYFGFQRFPFDRPEAGNEEFARPDFLAACFVEPDSFERILGQADASVTALLFAARGAGKTACRVMVDYYCQQGQVPLSRSRSSELGYVLSVPHIYLHRVHSTARQGLSSADAPTVLVEHHAYEILGRAIPALTDLVARVPELGHNLGNLSSFELQDLSWLILAYSHYLTSAQVDFLHSLGIDIPIENRQPIGFQAQKENPTKQPSWMSTFLQNRDQVSPLDHIALWAKLVHQIGIHATYVLVDGLDEFEETAADPQAAFKVVKPILACLRLMDGTPYFALKFFLPADIGTLVRSDSAIRHDRGFLVEKIAWQERDLIEILRRRLDALKRKDYKAEDRVVAGFDDLCVPELRGQIEHDLANWAAGNPRHLLVLCGMMITAHCNTDITDQDDPYQLNKSDLQAALEQFQSQVIQPGEIASIDDELGVRDLVLQGENNRIEFKSSMQWDLEENKVNKVLRQAIAKTIAGMLNSDGGTLLIGVGDDRAILGIERDLRSLPKSKQTVDGFKLALMRIVETYLGLEHMAYVRPRFELVDGETVCVVSIGRSPTPVFFSLGNAREFWVRMGNATRKLDVQAAMRYIQTHWNEME